MSIGLIRAQRTHGAHRRRRSVSIWTACAAVGGAAAVVATAGTVHEFGATRAVGLVALITAIVLCGRVRADAAGALIILSLSLLLIPARLRIAPLHAAGTPGSLIGIAAFLVWVYGRVSGRPWLARGPQPLRGAMTVFALTVLASYLAMGFRPHTVAEAKAADRGLLTMMSMTGVALLVAGVWLAFISRFFRSFSA